MTSQINPADIDGNYPIAGVSNNTQGMRDNFTNTRTNFQYAADEITDLQNKVVLKAALSGTTLDNNLGNNVVYNALVKGISGTVVAIANTSGTITIDCSAGPYQSINMAGNIALSFISNTWPTAGTLGMVRTQITVDQVGRTLTLPNTVSNGIVGIQGYASNVITFANTGTYEFGFSTTNAGNAITIFDFNRPLSLFNNDVTIAANTVSTSDTTGALKVIGGVGILGNLNVGGNLVTYTSSGNVAFQALDTGIVEFRTPALIAGNSAGALNIVGSADGSYQPVYNTGSMVHVTGNDGVSNRITLDTFGTGAAIQTSVVLRLARGTAAAPTAVQSGDILGRITGSGFGNASQYVLAAGNIGTLGMDFVALENYTTANAGSALKFYTSPIGAVTKTLSANVTANVSTFPSVSATGNVLTSAGNVLVTGGTGGVGYNSGAGGTVAQAGNKSGGVILNKQSGEITMQNSLLAAATIVSFVLTNSTIGTNDLLVLQHQSGGTLGAYTLNAACAAGSATIYVRNETAGSLSEALVIRYAVIKGAVA